MTTNNFVTTKSCGLPCIPATYAWKDTKHRRSGEMLVSNTKHHLAKPYHMRYENPSDEGEILYVWFIGGDLPQRSLKTGQYNIAQWGVE